MGRHRKLVQYLILAFVLLVGGYAIGNSLFTSSAVLAKGDKTPGFKLADLNNVAHDWKEYEGKPVILNFWGTFCPPCRDEMPALQKEYEKWHDQGLELVGINLSEDGITVERFASEVGAQFPILLDNDKKTERAFGLKQYPTTFFIAADGTIQDVVVGGPLAEEDIEARIMRLMETK
ncbi:redoxin domain-containing protein [Cohnella yongneupensis]|uniref:Redoxin domain-containing protein n=1 Tax=Cohnella yongneupensis TaxID=425006 RepID=A0ABW0R381_9BACL